MSPGNGSGLKREMIMTAKTNEFGGNLTWFLDEAIAQVDKSQSIDVITTNEDGSEGIIKLSLQDILVAAIDEINSKKRS